LKRTALLRNIDNFYWRHALSVTYDGVNAQQMFEENTLSFPAFFFHFLRAHFIEVNDLTLGRVVTAAACSRPLGHNYSSKGCIGKQIKDLKPKK
jgi:hypothetical protein